MFILYTSQFYGEWIPFNTPLTEGEIFERLWTTEDNGMISEEDSLYIPGGDLLPSFHSILLPNGYRWDAYNQAWTQCRVSDKWRLILENYVREWNNPERTFFWRDQEPPYWIHIDRAL